MCLSESLDCSNMITPARACVCERESPLPSLVEVLLAMSRSSTLFISETGEEWRLENSDKRKQTVEEVHQLGAKFLISPDVYRRVNAAAVPRKVHSELFKSEIHTRVCHFQNRAD